LHLAVALEGAGWHPASWREADAAPGDLLSANRWLDLVQSAERGLLDFVTIEDSHQLHSSPSGDVPERRTDRVSGGLDAIMRAAWLGARTNGIGIVPAAATTLSEPFLLSTQIATLDFVSHGRAGWLVQVPDLPGDDGYIGPRPVAAGEAAWAEAAEHVEIVSRLWDSWDDDAEIRDRRTHRFFDRERVHHINFNGKHLSVKGPSITPRPPQGLPIVAMALDPMSAAPARQLATSAADVIFVREADEASLKARYDQVRAALQEAGRTSAAVRVFADVAVLLDGDHATATRRLARLNDVADPDINRLGVLTFTGTPAGLAERLLTWHDQLGYDGFRLWPASLPHDLDVISEALTAELRRQGRFRAAYEAQTLRGLLGFERPASRYGGDGPCSGAGIGAATAGGK
jgi:alkanesulfonate monooxygenase SsuD/methylene tetrahydromethanopterin reductase-like flavin-dependent oxidoreductase (luciferase family)